MSGRRNRQRGFTLIETLVALGLMLVLLAGIWGTLQLFHDLQAKGAARIEKTQLIRSISQLLSQDLRAAIQDPTVPASRNRSGGTIRRFGLYGTADSLRIDVLQINPLVPSTEGDSAASTGALGGAAGANGSQVPELRTIYYTFVDPRDVRRLDLENLDDESRPGLTRRELDFETPGDGQSRTRGGALAQRASSLNPQGQGQRTIIDVMASDPENGRVWAPEVVRLRFRYFDGANWRNSWDSLKRRGLPMAVEVSLSLRSLDDVAQWFSVLAEGGATSSLSTLDATGAEAAPIDDPLTDAGVLDAQWNSMMNDPMTADAAWDVPADAAGATADAVDPRIREVLRKPTTDVRLVVQLPGSPLKQPTRTAGGRGSGSQRSSAPALSELRLVPAPVAVPAPAPAAEPRPAGTTRQRPTRTPRPQNDSWMRN